MWLKSLKLRYWAENHFAKSADTTYYRLNVKSRIPSHKKWILKTLLPQYRSRVVGYTSFFNPWGKHCGTSQSTQLNLNLSRLRHCGSSHSTQFTLSDVNRAKPTFVHFGTAASGNASFRHFFASTLKSCLTTCSWIYVIISKWYAKMAGNLHAT